MSSQQVTKTIPPSNNDAWINEAIDSVRFIGDVGQTDLHFLEHILPHCTVDQLMHVEKCSKGRDLSPVTDKLWKNFYERKFGKDETNLLIERMQQKKESSFKWKQLYEAKMKELEKKERESGRRLIQNYQREKARKQRRQIQIIEVPSSSNKKRKYERRVGFEYNTNTKSNMLKKTKREMALFRRNVVQKKFILL